MILFVVNEQSGNGRGARAWAKVKAALAAKGTSYRQVSAKTPEDAIAKTREALRHEQLKAVAVIGGDGTLHTLLPLLAGTGIPCGLIPSGSGNDTSRALGIPRDPLQALEVVLTGRARAIDLLDTVASEGERQLTLTAVAIGLDGVVADDVNRSRYKRWCNRLGVGSLAYVIGLFRALAMFRPQELTITLDGEPRHFRRAWLSAVANVSTYGGGLRICPDARPDDGKLHVCVVHDCGAARILTVFPSLLRGTHVRQSCVTMLSGTRLRLESSGKLLAFGDGEPSGTSPLEAELRPGQLLFLTAVSG